MILNRCAALALALAAAGWPVVATPVAASTRNATGPQGAAGAFDHEYRDFAALLRDHVVGASVDYAKLVRNRERLERVVREFGQPAASAEPGWSRAQRIAFWINAYNAFTLKAIVDHYPIKGSWFSLYPRNSIRQIDGVWDELTWQAAGRKVTLDEIEHGILRPTFKEARIHFAVNCASVSCPPIRSEPYRAGVVDQQLADAARAFLATDLGLQVDGSTLRVSSIFKWYGDDFIPRFAGLLRSNRSEKDRAILGFIVEYGPPAAAELAKRGTARISFLDYDWSLNDVTR